MSNFPQSDCKHCAYTISCIYEVLEKEERGFVNPYFLIPDGSVTLSKKIKVGNPIFLIPGKRGAAVGQGSTGYHVTCNATALCASDTTCYTVTSSSICYLIKNIKKAAPINIKMNDWATMNRATRETTYRILTSMKYVKMTTIANRRINIRDAESV